MLLVNLFHVIAASHFRGGLIYWKTVGHPGPVNVSDGLVPVEITQRFGWRRDFSNLTFCNETTIIARNMTGQNGHLVCQSGCPEAGQNLSSIQVYCTDFSVSSNWMVGERSYVVWLPYNGEVVTASYTGGNWIYLAYPPSKSTTAEWEIRVTFNFSATSLSRGNASPVTKMSPVISMIHGCRYIIKLPAVDPDGDRIKCRWANSSLGECSDVCMTLPGAQLDEDNCVISYNATGDVGKFAVTMQIEDFASPADVRPISSVPLQFLVDVMSSPIACDARPRFISPTEEDGTCIAIPPNTTYSGLLVARSSGPNAQIVDITTQSPAGMLKSPLMKGLGSNEWYVNVTWRPTSSRAGTNLYCFVAVENTTVSSDQSCVYFAVGIDPPLPRLGSMTPTGLIARNHSQWRVEFDQATTRPFKSAYIRFHDERGNEIVSVDVATDPSVVFDTPNSSTPSVLTFETHHLFDESSVYYITLDDGVAVGLQSCGVRSAGVQLSDFWVVFTGNSISDPVLSLPLLTIRLTPVSGVHDEQRPVECAFDVNSGSACLVQSSNVLLTVNCNEFAVSLTHSSPGFHTLDVASSSLTTTLQLDAKQVVEPAETRGWTQWTEWSGCSRSCDGGLQRRFRRCLNSRSLCDGDSTNIRFCNVFYCALGDYTTLLCFKLLITVRIDRHVGLWVISRHEIIISEINLD